MANRVLALAAVVEIATGIAMLVAPSFVGQLLLGVPLDGIAANAASVAGITLIALGIACWPGPALAGMLAYGTGITLYLGYLGLSGGATGAFLWPAVVFHLALSLLLARSWGDTKRGGAVGAAHSNQSR